MADNRYLLIDDYVVAGVLMAQRFIPFIRPDRHRPDRMVFVFKNTEEFKVAYTALRATGKEKTAS